MKLSIKIYLLFLITSVSTFYLSPKAFGQQDRLLGSWDLIGYRCAEGGNMVPVGSSTQEFTFYEGGEVKMTFHRVHDEEDDMTFEEYIEQRTQNAKDRVKKWYQEDVDRHEEMCNSNREDALCTATGKRDLYDKWWRDYENGALKDMLDEIEEEKEKEEDRQQAQSQNPCEISHYGTWQTRGDRLTVVENRVEATASCGHEGGRSNNRMSGRYYFENGNLRVVFPPIRDSREYCGNGDWVSIFLRK